MILKYLSSTGDLFDLKVGHIRTRTADFHNYQWKPQTITQQYGERVYRFDKGAVTYTALLSIFGSLDERRRWMNILHGAFDHDVINMTPGKIIHGMYSIDCYITMSSTYYENPNTQNQISIYCPYPFWSHTKLVELSGREGTYEYLDYPYGYKYDYKAKLPGYGMIHVEAEKPTHWDITIKGAVNDPMITIDNQTIGVYSSIGAGETLHISSRDKTVYKEGETRTNLFNQRVKSKTMFEPIPRGAHAVLWSGNYDISMSLYEERSEPPWI